MDQQVATPPVEVLVAASGFDIQYPIARTQRGDLLRPLKQPIYDTEILKSATSTSQIIYFAKPQGSADASGQITSKTVAETNLTQAGQITVPNQFKLFGFLYEVQYGLNYSDYNLIYNTAAYEFIFGGTRTYLQVPLTRIPQGMGTEGFAALDGNSTSTTTVAAHNGLGMVSNYYNFEYKKATMHIQSAENFQTKVSWYGGAISTTGGSNIRTRAYLLGVMFSGM